jgi:hypothetical protein
MVILRSSISLILLLAVLVCCGPAFGDSGTITGVQVSPDLRQVGIRFEGQAGKHSAFVIENPYRLVLDFDSTGLAAASNRIAVGRDPIDSIRLGQGNGRARVVVDFGDHPVPPFRIDRQASAVFVHLGSSAASRTPAIATRPVPPAPQPAGNRAPPVAARPTPVGAEAAPVRVTTVAKRPAVLDRREAAKPPEHERGPTGAKGPAMAVKSAGMADNLVFVEIADQKDPKRTYRLVIDMDREELNVRGATLSDPKGNVKRFQVMSSDGEAQPRAEVEKIEPKTAETSGASNAGKGKFKWGLRSSQSDPELDQAEKGSQLRLERFELKPKPKS